MTETPEFGSSKRESHDASGFYSRFAPFVESTDETVIVNDPGVVDRVVCWDAAMGMVNNVADDSVALVVTSPPYFSGRDYETGDDSPEKWTDYEAMLWDVFDECLRVLEPGGRIAVNVAGLGRRPYVDLPGIVSGMLTDQRFLLRGVIVWVKGKGANGSAAWGSWRSPSAPVMRDTTERIVVASKGRMSRAVKWQDRKKRGLPWEATISGEDFMRDTLDVWEMRPESAKRIGHSAPFPVELPKRLINLHTYRGDVVLDPFMGSGSTAVAAKGLDRRFVGFDVDEGYCELARRRIAETEPGGLLDRGDV